MVPDPQKHQIWIADANSQWHLKDIHKHKCGNKVICTNNSQQREGCQDAWHTKLQYTCHVSRHRISETGNHFVFSIHHSIRVRYDIKDGLQLTVPHGFWTWNATVNQELSNRIEQALTWYKPRIVRSSKDPSDATPSLQPTRMKTSTKGMPMISAQ